MQRKRKRKRKREMEMEMETGREERVKNLQVKRLWW